VCERINSAIEDLNAGASNVVCGALTIAVLCIPSAIILGITRFAIYLRQGEAPSSLCETAAYFTNFNAFDCVIETDRIKFNRLSTWALFETDASLALLLIALIILMLVVAFGVVCASLKAMFARLHRSTC
jgi:hypothetical protein